MVSRFLGNSDRFPVLSVGKAMVSHQPNALLLIFTIIVMIIPSSEANNSFQSKTLPHPFGFSQESLIRFNRSETGLGKIGEFVIQNVTASSIFVEIQPDCKRSIDKISVLFGDNYAPSWHNVILLQSCRTKWKSCLITRRFIEEQLNLRTCKPMSDSLGCFSRNGSEKAELMSYADVANWSPCRLWFSSIASDLVSRRSDGDSGFSLKFERLRLDWWLKGNCTNRTCSENANCTGVKLPDGGFGHRCSCLDGFDGNGFVGTGGCQLASKRQSHSGGTKFRFLVGGVIVGASLMLVFTLICYRLRKQSASLRSLSSAKRLLFEAAGNSSVRCFTYKEIEKATDGFSDKQRLGIGAYGTVYAGKLHNDLWVAIKRLRHRDHGCFNQVINEIKLVCSVSHPNLVQLLGCCIQDGEPILVYEFMPNGTLSQHLQRDRGNGLPWIARLAIAAQTAKALTYLHSSVTPPIYHRDIKSSNILLDYDLNSKISDFGLSRLGMTEFESSHISTAPQGTPGYLDPQYHQDFQLSDKSDVYSFGVVLLEIITSLKVVDFNRPHSEVNLAALAVDRIGRGCVSEIIDPCLEADTDSWTFSSIHNVAELAFRCLAFHRDMRPTMMEVAEELEHIRLSSWVSSLIQHPSMADSHLELSDNGSERSASGMDVIKKDMSGQDSSPVSVQDIWPSEHNSPLENSF